METDLRNLEISTLLDLLVQHTAACKSIQQEGGSKAEFNESKRIINLVQEEIIFRQREEVISMSNRSNPRFTARSTG